MIEYKGYVGVVTYEPEEDTFHGRVISMRDIVSFYGTSVDELKRVMANSVDEYLAVCKELGRPANRPYSGKLSLRIDPALHSRIASAAAREQKSVNRWIAEHLEEDVA